MVLTDAGISVLARRGLSGITHVSIGTGTTRESPADASLVREAARLPVADSSEYGGTIRVVGRFVHGDTGDLDITEVGLHDAAAGGALIARIVYRQAREIRANRALTATFVIQQQQQQSAQ